MAWKRRHKDTYLSWYPLKLDDALSSDFKHLVDKSGYPESHVLCYQWKTDYKITAKAKSATSVKSLKKMYIMNRTIPPATRRISRTSATSKKEYFATLVTSFSC